MEITEDRRPLAIFCVGPRVDRTLVTQELQREGIQCQYFDHAAQVEAELSNERLFVIFVDLDIPRSESSALIKMMRGKRCAWIILAQGLSNLQLQTFFEAGATDVLRHPLQGLPLRTRTELLLVRFLRQYQMPPDTLLPALKTIEGPDDKPSHHFPVVPGTYRCAERSPDFYNIKRSMLAQTSALNSKLPPHPRHWPTYFAQISTTAHKNFSNQQRQVLMHKILVDTAEVTGATRISMFSLRPFTSSLELPPLNLFPLLVSHRTEIDFDLQVPSELFPQIEIALEKERAISVNARTPQKIGELERHPIWCLAGAGDYASAVIPLYDGRFPYAVILLQFNAALKRQTDTLLGQTAHMFKQIHNQCLQVDYFGRLYRKKIY